jgi:predicted  nucleic acid-binding Zn-ribbon protein
MDAQLEILLQIQDLRAQRRELAEGHPKREVQAEAFQLQADAAIARLDEKIAEVVAELAPGVRQRYERLAAGTERTVAPAINGVCYGCFVSVPISLWSDPVERERLRNCDRCGRFLYFVG